MWINLHLCVLVQFLCTVLSNPTFAKKEAGNKATEFLRNNTETVNSSNPNINKLSLDSTFRDASLKSADEDVVKKADTVVDDDTSLKDPVAVEKDMFTKPHNKLREKQYFYESPSETTASVANINPITADSIRNRYATESFIEDNLDPKEKNSLQQLNVMDNNKIVAMEHDSSDMTTRSKEKEKPRMNIDNDTINFVPEKIFTNNLDRGIDNAQPSVHDTNSDRDITFADLKKGESVHSVLSYGDYAQLEERSDKEVLEVFIVENNTKEKKYNETNILRDILGTIFIIIFFIIFVWSTRRMVWKSVLSCSRRSKKRRYSI